jgi:hypothetical protein
LRKARRIGQRAATELRTKSGARGDGPCWRFPVLPCRSAHGSRGRHTSTVRLHGARVTADDYAGEASGSAPPALYHRAFIQRDRSV